MTAAVRFRGRRKPTCSQRVATGDIDCESDPEGTRALHIRKMQMIRRQMCNAASEEPVPAQEPKKTNFLSQNFKLTDDQISPVTLHLKKHGLKRLLEVNEVISGDRESIDRKRQTVVHSEAALDLQEYDLSIEDKLRNIRATEAAKQAAKRKNTVTANVFQGQKTIPINIGCNFQQYENEQGLRNACYGASDELVFQQFRKRVS